MNQEITVCSHLWTRLSETMKAKVGAASLIQSGDSEATSSPLSPSLATCLSRLLPLGMAAQGREESPVCEATWSLVKSLSSAGTRRQSCHCQSLPIVH